MLKKSVVYGALLATVCITPSLAHSFYKTGFLAGAQVGASFGNGKFNSTFNPPAIGGVTSTSFSGSANKTAALFGILAGYRTVFNQDSTFGFNLEANVFSNNQLNKQFQFFANTLADSTVNNQLKKTYSIIPSVTLGKVFCGRWHASLGLGLAISRFKQTVTGVAGAVVGSSASANQNKIGIVPSVGIEYAASPNVSFTGNLSYEIYGKVSKTFQDAAKFGTGASYLSSIKPKYLTLKVGAVYKF